MLTDLRTRLKSVGRLEVMNSVNQRAMSYYEHQGDLRAMPDESLERRTRILTAMALEDDDKRSNPGAAFQKISEAHRTTGAILARRPDDPQAIFSHAQSKYWLGYLAYERRQRPERTARFIVYKRRLADRLVAMQPDNGCMTAFFIAEGKGAMERYGKGFIHHYNINIEVRETDEHGGVAWQPIVIDPDIRHPGRRMGAAA